MELFRHLFLPHHTNNYRARAIHIDSLSIYAILLLIFQIFIRTIHATSPTVLGYATDISSEVLLAETNAKRTAQGLNALQINDQLSQAAMEKAKHMFTHNYWAHVGIDGKTPWDFINDSGYAYQYAGENLAKNFLTSPEVVQAWMESPSHKDNILKPIYTDIGFAVLNGILEGEETTLVVQMFGRPHNYHLVQQSKSAITLQAESTDIGTNMNTVNNPVAGLRTENEHSTLLKSTSQIVSGVRLTPIFDLKSLNTGVVGGFITFLLFVLVLDALIVYKKRHVRVTGHPIGHILFLLTLAIVSLVETSGAVL